MPASEKMCYNSLELTKVNPRAPLGGETAIERAVGEVLCVDKTNHYRLGEYFEDTAVYSDASVFDQNFATKGYSYIPDTILISTDPYYDQVDSSFSLTTFYDTF